MNIRIEVEGLKEFQKAVRDADREFAIELRKGLNEAAEVVVAAARPTIPRRSGRLASSLKAQSTQREGRVVLGGSSVPYAGWIEFGGRVGINRSVSRPLVKTGRYLYPAFESQRPKVEAIAEHVLSRTADRAGL